MGASSPLSFGYVQVNLFDSGARVLGEKGSFSQASHYPVRRIHRTAAAPRRDLPV